jgi:hypothetical protein
MTPFPLCSFYNGYFIKAPADPNSEFPYEVTMKVCSLRHHSI